MAVDLQLGDLVHGAMGHAWRINSDHPMAFIFDTVNPARQLRKGMLYSDEADFPELDSEHHSQHVTYVDTAAPGWMPFNPPPYR